MPEEACAWLLNLDAELEYAAPLGYTPNRSLLQLIEARTPDLRGLVGNATIIAAQGGQRGIAKGLIGMAWSPTPHALRQLARSGATLLPAPDFEVLRGANSRQFCAELGQTLPGAHFAAEASVAVEFIRASRSDQRWLVKRVFGFAGRGQRRMRKGLSADDVRWLHDSERTGGVQIEPLLDLTLELSQHGLLTASGSLTLGRLCIQRTDENRAWQETRPALPDEVSAATHGRLQREATSVAEALQRIRYFGPFGVDAFIYRDGEEEVLNPRSEINARYSMGYAAGMGPTK